MPTRFLPVLLTAATLVLPFTATANEFEPQIRSLIEDEVRPWLKDAAVVDAVAAQNERHASLDPDRVAKLDEQWVAEAREGEGPLVDKVMGNALSDFLSTKKSELGGRVSEVFVMDNKGLNVGASNLTSDYYQGDEAKWQESYGTGRMHIGEVEFDDSAEAFLSQVSLPIEDPSSGEAIGAITLGVNVEELF
jgi:hypothetical protein